MLGGPLLCPIAAAEPLGRRQAICSSLGSSRLVNGRAVTAENRLLLLLVPGRSGIQNRRAGIDHAGLGGSLDRPWLFYSRTGSSLIRFKSSLRRLGLCADGPDSGLPGCRPGQVISGLIAALQTAAGGPSSGLRLGPGRRTDRCRGRWPVDRRSSWFPFSQASSRSMPVSEHEKCHHQQYQQRHNHQRGAFRPGAGKLVSPAGGRRPWCLCRLSQLDLMRLSPSGFRNGLTVSGSLRAQALGNDRVPRLLSGSVTALRVRLPAWTLSGSGPIVIIYCQGLNPSMPTHDPTYPANIQVNPPAGISCRPQIYSSHPLRQAAGAERLVELPDAAVCRCRPKRSSTCLRLKHR